MAKRTIEAASVAALCVATMGCVAHAPPPATPGTHRAEAPAAPRGVEFAIRTPDGEWLHIGDLRGRPVLLIFLATFDNISQATLVPIRRMVAARDDVRVVGVLGQQDAHELADAWVHALDPPFPVGYDVEGVLENGESELAPIEAVPTYIVLDAEGIIAERHVGYQDERELNEFVDRARARAPLREPTPPPLLGTPRAR